MLHIPGSSSSAPQAGDSPGVPTLWGRTCWGAQGAFSPVFRSAGNPQESACWCREQGVFQNLGTKGHSQTPCPRFSPLNAPTLTNNQTQIIPCFPGQPSRGTITHCIHFAARKFRSQAAALCLGWCMGSVLSPGSLSSPLSWQLALGRTVAMESGPAGPWSACCKVD